MLRNKLFLLSLVLVLLLTTGAGPIISSSYTGIEAELGESGTSFRYVTEYGELDAPYLADAEHLNGPYGLHIGTDDVLLAAEGLGSRVMGYDMNGANTLWLGTAEVCNPEGVFCSPLDSATDPDGNIWVVDSWPGRLLEFTELGDLIQEFKPEGEQELINPVGVAIDPLERMFISNTDNNRIDVYDISTGTPIFSTTITNTGVLTDTFLSPNRLVTDDLGNLFVADSGNNRVLVCYLNSGAWECITIDDELSFPQGLGIDLNADGDPLYIADTGGGRVVRCTESTGCNDFASGFSTAVYDTAVDGDGNVYVALGDASVVQKFAPDGSDLGVFVGEEGVPYLTDAYHYNRPNVAADMQGNIYAIEYEGKRITKLDATGTAQWSFGVPGVGGFDDSHLWYPQNAAADGEGNVYVAEAYGLHILTATGAFSTTIDASSPCFSNPGDPGPGSGLGVAVDGDGLIYIADAAHRRVQVCDQDLGYVATLGELDVPGDDDAHFSSPVNVGVDAQDNLYVVDAGNCRVQKFDTYLVHQMTFGVTGNCTPTFGNFDWPISVAIDPEGRVYVVDGPERAQVFDADGKYLTAIGGVNGRKTGEFTELFAVGVDDMGNLYAADYFGDRIKKFSLGVPNWRQANINGFGIMDTIGATALEVFQGQLYVGTSNWAEGASMLRTSDGKHWEPLIQPGFGLGTNNSAIIDLYEYDEMLYAGTSWSGTPGEMWRSTDGISWTPVITDGFGVSDNGGITNFLGFGGMLYAGTTNPNGYQLWRSPSGDTMDWTNVITAGMGYSQTFQVVDLIEYDGRLYVGTETPSTADPASPFQIWRTVDGTNWEAVTLDGFGDIHNTATGAFMEWDGWLYVGTWNEVTGGQIWRTKDGLNWEPVMQDGFGDVGNIKVEAITAFEWKMYAVTFNPSTGTEIWMSTDGMLWSQIIPDGFGDSNNVSVLWNSAIAIYKSQLYFSTWNSGNFGEVWAYPTSRTVFVPLVVK